MLHCSLTVLLLSGLWVVLLLTLTQFIFVSIKTDHITWTLNVYFILTDWWSLIHVYSCKNTIVMSLLSQLHKYPLKVTALLSYLPVKISKSLNDTPNSWSFPKWCSHNIVALWWHICEIEAAISQLAINSTVWVLKVTIWLIPCKR